MDPVTALREELAKVALELESTADRMRQLTELEHSLRVTLAHLAGEDLPLADPIRSRPAKPKQDRSRTREVELVLREAVAPMNRHELAAALLDRGRLVTSDDVSASLTYLRRTGRARIEGSGWAAIPR